ncbi:hypothetical protein ACP8HI_22500 [Paenibacillus sp. FA6]
MKAEVFELRDVLVAANSSNKEYGEDLIVVSTIDRRGGEGGSGR